MASELAERIAYELEALMASETAMQQVAAECPTPEAHHAFLADFIERVLQKETIDPGVADSRPLAKPCSSAVRVGTHNSRS